MVEGVFVLVVVLVLVLENNARSKEHFLGGEAVGNAVTRNRVKRQLRHLAAASLGGVPYPVDVVVRALPAAASRDFRGDFRDAFAAAVGKLAS